MVFAYVSNLYLHTQIYEDNAWELNLKIIRILGIHAPLSARMNALRWGKNIDIYYNEDYRANYAYLKEKGYPVDPHLEFLNISANHNIFESTIDNQEY